MAELAKICRLSQQLTSLTTMHTAKGVDKLVDSQESKHSLYLPLHSFVHFQAFAQPGLVTLFSVTPSNTEP